MKKRVIVKGPALSASGYGEHARFVLRALRKREDIFDIYLHNLNWGKVSWVFEDTEERQWIDRLIKKTANTIQQHNFNKAEDWRCFFDLSMQVTIPNEFEPIAAANIGVTAGIETTKVAPEWLQKANVMDKVIVVSNHAKYGFENSKYPYYNDKQEHVGDLVCDAPVYVVGYPVRQFAPADVDFKIETDFNFLAVALWGQRKNIEKTIINFVEEFQFEKDVGLVVKTAFRGGSVYDKALTEKALKNLLKTYPDRKCKIYLVHGRLTEEEMTALYQHDKIKCMISLAHGEGFGLPLFEAAHNGLPIIATDWSGQVDFLYAPKKDKKGKEKMRGLFGKVAYDLQKVQKESVWDGVITPESMWAYPKDNSAKEKMRDVYKDYPRAKSKAKQLQKHVKKEFDPDKMYKKMTDTLTEYTLDAEIESQQNQATISQVREEAKKIPAKKRIKFLAEHAREFSDQKAKIDLFKDSMKGEKCYITSCGPTLLDNDMDKLKAELAKYPCMAIKQSLSVFEELADIHVYNCANFKRYQYKHDNGEGNHIKPLVVEASTTPDPLWQCDLKFTIQERDFSRSVCALHNFDEWTLDKSPTMRPYGPGIMTEIVIYLVEHLGFSEIVTVGWDNKVGGDGRTEQHFYRKENFPVPEKERMINSNETWKIVPVEQLREEERVSVEAIPAWNNWLKEKGCTLKICSSTNEADEGIERVKI